MHLDNYTFAEISELYYLMHPESKHNPYQTYDKDVPLRKKAISSQEGEDFYYVDKDGVEKNFLIQKRFLYDGKMYLLLMWLNCDEEMLPPSIFFEYIYADDPEDDEMIEVVDKDLIKVLKQEYKNITDQ